MHIHPCHIRLTITLDHAQELPAVPFIEGCMIGDQIGGRNSFDAQIFHCHTRKSLPDSSCTTILSWLPRP